MQMTTKITKNIFLTNLDPRSGDPLLLVYFLKSNINQFNSTSSNFLQYQKTQINSHLPSWLFILKHFSKLIKNTQQIKRQFQPRSTRF